MPLSRLRSAMTYALLRTLAMLLILLLFFIAVFIGLIFIGMLLPVLTMSEHIK